MSAPTDAQRMLAAMFPALPDDERAILCGFTGDPAMLRKNAWRPRPWARGDAVPFAPEANAYVCVSTFRRHADGTWRRRREGFAAAHAFMIDDLGTKLARDVLDALAPSALIETSRGNFQAWYWLSEPEPDAARYKALGDAFIARWAAGIDPGMAGFNRVGRLPGHVNGKPQHAGWRCVAHELNERRYPLPLLAEAFEIAVKLDARGASAEALLHPSQMPDELRRQHEDFFLMQYGVLKRLGFVRTGRPDAAGWVEIRCPWTEEHTGRADNGAALRMPHPDNNYHGAFHCHHGHCAEKGWRQLTDWIDDANYEDMQESGDAL